MILSSEMIQLRNIEKCYKTKAGFTYVLRQINLDIAEADFVTVNSKFTRARVAELGCPEQKLSLLPVGLELEAFPFKERIWQL